MVFGSVNITGKVADHNIGFIKYFPILIFAVCRRQTVLLLLKGDSPHGGMHDVVKDVVKSVDITINLFYHTNGSYKNVCLKTIHTC